MSDTPTPLDVVGTAPAGSESAAGGQPADSGTPGTPEPPKANKEARYRVERNEARAERDALAQRVEALQRAELERLAGDTMSNPADLLALTGQALADFLTEDGELDAELVAKAAAELLATRPGLRKGSPAFDPSQGSGGKPAVKREPSWGALLKD